MKASSAIAKMLRAMAGVLARQDEERSRFEVQILKEVGEFKAQADANAAMLKEVRDTVAANHGMLKKILAHMSAQQAEIQNVRSDLEAHTGDRLRHAANA